MGRRNYNQYRGDGDNYGPQRRDNGYGWNGPSDYNRGANDSYKDRQRQTRKRSGAKYGFDKNGNPFVRGWKATRFGLITYLAVPTSKTGSHEGKTQTWQNWMVKVNPPTGMGNEYTTSGLFSEETHKVIVSSEGIVMNPNAPNGGYCGRFGGKR